MLSVLRSKRAEFQHTDGRVSLDHVEDMDLLQRGGFHLLQLLDRHLLRRDLNNLHRQLLSRESVHTPAHHAAHTPKSPST